MCVPETTLRGKGDAWCPCDMMEALAPATSHPTNISGTVHCARACLVRVALGGIWGGAAFHTWVPVEHKGGPPAGGRHPEAVSVEDLSPLESLRVSVSRGRPCTPWRVGNGGDQTGLGQLSRDREASAVILVTRG